MSVLPMTSEVQVAAIPKASQPGFQQTATPVLETRCVGVSLGDRQIVSDVSLEIRAHEILAIIGPSGCGKSTFISTLNRMIHHTLPSAQVQGDILLNGISIYPTQVNETELRCKIAMVFQRPNPFPFSIRMNMEFALKAIGNRRKSSYADKIKQALHSVNLWDSLKDRMDDIATCLSGGEQQRLCIARALLCDPDVILFDEPCSALDPVSCTAIEGLIQRLKQRCAVVIVTHNLAQARRISDRCAFFGLYKGSGQVIEYGTTKDLLTNPKHEMTRAYIWAES